MLQKIASIINFNKYSIIYNLDPQSDILDIGCGNHSPSQIKAILPDCKYTGVDIDYYNYDIISMRTSSLL